MGRRRGQIPRRMRRYLPRLRLVCHVPLDDKF